MHVPILLFAGAQQLVSHDRIWLEIPEPITAGELLEMIGHREPILQNLVVRSRLAVNGRYVTSHTVIDPHAEIALIPPVSGG